MIVFVLQATTTNWETMDTVIIFFTREDAIQFAIKHNLKNYVIGPQTINGKII